MKKIPKTKVLLLILLAMILNGCASGSNKGQAQSAATPDPTSQNDSSQNNTSQDNSIHNSNAHDRSAIEEEQITFEAQDMEGNVVSSNILANAKLTMINVWATYCNPCLSEMPGLGELAGEYDPADFQLFGIISDVLEGGEEGQIALAASLIEQTGANYPHLLLNRSLYNGLLTDVTAVPTTFFFDENGTLLDTVVGAMDKSVWEEKINGFLEK